MAVASRGSRRRCSAIPCHLHETDVQRTLDLYPRTRPTARPARMSGSRKVRVRSASLRDIERLTTEVHLRYQSADYSAATRILPSLIKSVYGLVSESRGAERRRALELQSSVYGAAAKLVTKVGNGELAWLTADRAASAALHTESPALGAAAAYQVACAFLKNDRLEEAATIATVSAANLDDDSPAGPSLRRTATPGLRALARRANVLEQ